MKRRKRTEKPLIEFTELNSTVAGEGLEELVRHIGRRKGLSPSWSGRGSDGGRDLLFEDIQAGLLSTGKIRWLVSCKDKARSRQSVTEKDFPRSGIKDKILQHKANGFLLVTTTTVSSGAKALLDSLDVSNGGDIHTKVWDSSELTSFLLEPANEDFLKQFLPISYKRVRALNSLESTILQARGTLPDLVLAKVLNLVNLNSDILSGSMIWPFDPAQAKKINEIIKHVVKDNNLEEAARATQKIDSIAFLTFVERLHENYYDECHEYLSAIICGLQNRVLKNHAAQFLFDHYVIEAADLIRFRPHLSHELVEELFSFEIETFIRNELLLNASQYDLLGSARELSSIFSFKNLTTSDTTVRSSNTTRIDFHGRIYAEVSLDVNDELIGTYLVPGKFSGYIDEEAMHLVKAKLDTRSLYS
ncbi:MAG: hypothetical protein EYC68_20170 [Chloroflexota bacterium]|nr:MAG: hypothetical protein EYC68_20170 [Chloroflexota bacterium]